MPRKVRNVCFVLLGVAALSLKSSYAGLGEVLVHSYAGNLAVSFAVYFVVANLAFPPRFAAPMTAGLALAAVELFELLDGFGVMSNVFDPFDLVANAAGVALALVVDWLTRG